MIRLRHWLEQANGILDAKMEQQSSAATASATRLPHSRPRRGKLAQLIGGIAVNSIRPRKSIFPRNAMCAAIGKHAGWSGEPHAREQQAICTAYYSGPLRALSLLLSAPILGARSEPCLHRL